MLAQVVFHLMPAVGRYRASADTISWLDPRPDQPRPDVSTHDLRPSRVGNGCPGGRSDIVINTAASRLVRSIAPGSVELPRAHAF